MENTLNQGFTFDLPKGNSSIIKVIGVGGGGNNALMHMYEKGIHGVDFIICNTDAQTLDNNPVSNKVQLGISITEGLGAGADPEVGEKAAIESIDDIKAALGQNTKMVFITAGMGGGTGTGAAPVIAKIAKEMGILTVGIVTVPFSFEGRRRLEQAESGLEKLRNNVDSLIVINNDKLRQQFGNLGFKQGFSKADEVLTNAAKGMAEVITAPFTINIDFRDAKSVLQNSGTALMSTGSATGEKRAEEAVRKALDSPLLNDNKITGAKDVLLLIQSGTDEAHEATMDEIGLINDYIQSEAGNTANIIFGVGTDESLGEAIKVLVIATGFAKEKNTGHVEKEFINLHDRPERRESPFKTRKERGEDTAGDTIFLLDDEEDQPASPFFTSTKQDAIDKAAAEQDTQDFEKENLRLEDDSDEDEMLSIFSSDRDEDETVSFTFDFEGENPAEGGRNTGDFSFFINEPKEEEPKIQVRSNSGDPDTLGSSSKFGIENRSQSFSPVPAANIKEADAPIENTEDELPQKETETIVYEEEVEQFTIISKSVSAKAAERRNKLKEFNSRYQNFESDNDFETVPAFRRKNINISQENASEQQINTFLAEDQRGGFQVRENRFLNKDVD
ncbi:cell division protein FtsZ [Cruoricaptor ignavus]|uniref:Cell division protein FtsZ n=1 Tax=Cruoricaptor ignavus TaxID=1118202 RepID=A0A7M1T069_9FLAO|nr:cell division protein FtsZ [Cruoricaptor ignavus]QOR73209.1 cell division protein FtsZ [Cruoricaptor ignavus]